MLDIVEHDDDGCCGLWDTATMCYSLGVQELGRNFYFLLTDIIYAKYNNISLSCLATKMEALPSKQGR